MMWILLLSRCTDPSRSGSERQSVISVRLLIPRWLCRLHPAIAEAASRPPLPIGYSNTRTTLMTFRRSQQPARYVCSASSSRRLAFILLTLAWLFFPFPPAILSGSANRLLLLSLYRLWSSLDPPCARCKREGIPCTFLPSRRGGRIPVGCIAHVFCSRPLISRSLLNHTVLGFID